MSQSPNRITAIHCTPIAIADPPLLNAAGLHAPYALRIIVEIETEAEVTGISEIPGSEKILNYFKQAEPIILGKDICDLYTVQRQLVEQFGNMGAEARGVSPWDQRTIVHIFSAVEVACLDILGKMLNRSMTDLLGGNARERVPFAAYLFYKYEGAGGELEFGTDPRATGWANYRQAAAIDPKGIVEQAIGMCKHFGFQSIKLKGGAFPPEEEVAAIKALYEEFGPEIPLRLDPNAIWSLDTALIWGKEMLGILEYYEDPVRGQKNMAALRKKLDLPLATNMCTTSFEQIPQSIHLHSEDIILSDHHFWGGLRASMQLNKICQTFGRGFSMHSNSHLGISMAAMAHLGAAVPHLDYALDTHYPWQEDEIIVGGKIPIEDGYVTPPSGPGLGVEIDRLELERLHQNYLECGLKERNDEIEMQKLHPDWKFQLTRY